MPIIEAIAWGIGFGVVAVFLVGLRRLSWRYSILVGFGAGVVLAALRLALLDAGFDPGLLVLIGAVGASLATLGTERGERARVRRTAAILANAGKAQPRIGEQALEPADPAGPVRTQDPENYSGDNGGRRTIG